VAPFRWDLRVGINGVHRALRFAQTAIDAFIGMDIELVFALVDAVDGADRHTGLIFDTDARLADDIGH
jgi:hypothetical protein